MDWKKLTKDEGWYVKHGRLSIIVHRPLVRASWNELEWNLTCKAVGIDNLHLKSIELAEAQTEAIEIVSQKIAALNQKIAAINFAWLAITAE